MKKIFIFFFVFFINDYELFAQNEFQSLSNKFNYVWVTGRANNIASPITGYGGSLVDFNHNPVLLKYNPRDQEMYVTNASIADSSGRLQFYTNGCEITGADDETLDNGDMLNPGFFRDVWCNQYEEGMGGGHHNTLILPWPDTADLYCLFHKSYSTVPGFTYCSKLLYSTVDMALNNGKGRVVQKNKPLVEDSLSIGELAAVKHANGRDWWVVTTRRNSNEFYVFLFTHEGIADTLFQTIGDSVVTNGLLVNEAQGQMLFSPDGARLFRTNRYAPVMVYDFDRENGVFTHYTTILFEYGNQFEGGVGCALSPNSRFLYLLCREYLYQLDLEAPDISASQTTVAVWDGFTTPLPTLFFFAELAPDCKIYMLAGGDTRYWHVIHRPDEPGLACNVEQRGLVLPTRCGSSMPHFPNYRLGPPESPGVPCSPTVSAGGPLNPLLGGFSVFPNPFSDYVQVLQNDPAHRAARFALYDALGRPVLQQSLPAQGLEAGLRISTGALPAGAYYYRIEDAEGRLLQRGVVLKTE
jgi:hypothetical protein